MGSNFKLQVCQGILMKKSNWFLKFEFYTNNRNFAYKLILFDLYIYNFYRNALVFQLNPKPDFPQLTVKRGTKFTTSTKDIASRNLRQIITLRINIFKNMANFSILTHQYYLILSGLRLFVKNDNCTTNWIDKIGLKRKKKK